MVCEIGRPLAADGQLIKVSVKVEAVFGCFQNAVKTKRRNGPAI